MHRGYIKDWRKIKEWEWFKAPHMYKLFMHLIREANYKDTRYQGRLIKRGQLVTGRKVLSAETGISEQSVRTCLERLVDSKEINIIPTSKFSIITIIEYNTYQSGDDNNNQPINQQANQQSTINQPASNHQSTTSKELFKKVKKVKKKSKSVNQTEYLPDFLEIWTSYKCPTKKIGSKEKAQTKYNELIKAGYKHDDLLRACVECSKATKNDKDGYWRMLQTFFGPEKYFEAWLETKTDDFVYDN